MARNGEPLETIARRLRCSERTVYRYLARLVEEGEVSEDAYQFPHEVRMKLRGERVRQKVAAQAVSKHAPTVKRPEAGCVCGAPKLAHRNFKGSCASTGCPEFYPRGA